MNNPLVGYAFQQRAFCFFFVFFFLLIDKRGEAFRRLVLGEGNAERTKGGQDEGLDKGWNDIPARAPCSPPPPLFLRIRRLEEGDLFLFFSRDTRNWLG
jgi:hypothetical protein